METQPDPELTDPDLGTEIELLADLMEAAATRAAHLRQDEVDAALRLEPTRFDCPQGGGLPTPPTHPGSASRER
jgi:hypothetical protein